MEIWRFNSCSYSISFIFFALVFGSVAFTLSFAYFEYSSEEVNQDPYSPLILCQLL